MTRVLLTGATGYVGGELLPVLLQTPTRPRRARETSLTDALDGIEVALYLVHSMGAGS
jgi:uncharacterized protein YbjT (DUF2867 family)